MSGALLGNTYFVLMHSALVCHCHVPGGWCYYHHRMCPPARYTSNPYPLDQLMATVQEVADKVSTLAANVGALTTAVQALTTANSTTAQAAFEAQLDPLNAALEQLNAATGTLLGVVNAANGQ